MTHKWAPIYCVAPIGAICLSLALGRAHFTAFLLTAGLWGREQVKVSCSQYDSHFAFTSLILAVPSATAGKEYIPKAEYIEKFNEASQCRLAQHGDCRPRLLLHSDLLFISLVKANFNFPDIKLCKSYINAYAAVILVFWRRVIHIGIAQSHMQLILTALAHLFHLGAHIPLCFPWICQFFNCAEDCSTSVSKGTLLCFRWKLFKWTINYIIKSLEWLIMLSDSVEQQSLIVAQANYPVEPFLLLDRFVEHLFLLVSHLPSQTQ